ncbi:MAG: hypothetical protein WC803_07160 [Sphingomonas sp.]
MFTRIFSAAALLALAGCTAQPVVDDSADSVAQGAAAIACATGGDRAFAPRCSVEQEVSARGTQLTVRNPDGGFHRLLLTADARGVIAADGAVAAIVSVTGADEIEVALGKDRYRLPATIGAPATRKP